MKVFSKTLTALLLVLALGIFTVEMPVSEVRSDEVLAPLLDIKLA